MRAISVVLLIGISMRASADGVLPYFNTIGHGPWPGTSIIWSPAALTLNPALAGSIQNAAFSLSGGFIRSQSLMRTMAPTDYVAESAKPWSWKASLFGVKRLNPKVAIGLSAFEPYRVSSSWSADWEGRFIVQGFSWRPFVVQPTLSYAISENVQAGISAQVGLHQLSFQRALPLADNNGEEGVLELAAVPISVAPQIGMAVTGGPLNAGLSVRLPANILIGKGSTGFQAPQSVADSFPAANTFSTELHQPLQALGHFTFAFNDQTSVSAGASYTASPNADSLLVDYGSNTSLLPDEYVYMNRSSEFSVWAGFAHILKQQATISAGLFYSSGTTEEQYLTPLAPDAGKAGLYICYSHPLSSMAFLDVALDYLETALIAGSLVPSAFEGTYKSRTVGLQVGVRIVME